MNGDQAEVVKEEVGDVAGRCGGVWCVCVGRGGGAGMWVRGDRWAR